MATATNVLLRNTGLLEPRPGTLASGRLFTSSDFLGLDAAWERSYVAGEVSLVYGQSIGSGTYSIQKGSIDGAGYTNLGAYAAYTINNFIPGRMAFAQAQQTTYFNTTVGVKQCQFGDTTVRDAGELRAQDISAVGGSTVGAGPWMATDRNVAYRVVWGRYQKNPDRTILGAPSGRTNYANASGSTVYPQLVVPIPSGTSSADFFRVYRSHTAATASTATDDQYYLAYENTGVDQVGAGVGLAAVAAGTANVTVTAPNTFRVGTIIVVGGTATGFDNSLYSITSANSTSFHYTQSTVSVGAITNNGALTFRGTSFSINDYMPEELLYDPLYTNSVDFGERAPSLENNQPPLCTDMTYWKDCMWHANTKSRQSFFLGLLGTSAPDGLKNNDTITIGGVTYTAKAAPGGGTDFQLTTGGASPSSDVTYTAQALVHCINLNSQTITATYFSPSLDYPFGRIYLEEVAIGGSTLGISSSNANAWFPRLSSSTVFDIEIHPSYLYYSKPNQPEAVPKAQKLPIGDQGSEIVRIVPFRDRLFVFKNDGLYQVTGEYGGFRVDLFDDTVLLVSPRSVASVNNHLYAFTSKGVVQINSAGALVVSPPIADDLQPLQILSPLTSDPNDYSQKVTFGLGIDDLNLYLMQAADENNTLYTYNALSGSWSTWEFYDHQGMSNGSVAPSGRVEFLFNGEANQPLLLERITSDNVVYAACDIKNPNTTTTEVTAVTDTTITFAPGHNIEVGDVIESANFNPGTQDALLVVGTVVGNLITLFNYQNGYAAMFTVGDFVPVYHPNQATAVWTPYFGGAPDVSKQFSDLNIHFQKASIGGVTVGPGTNWYVSTSTDAHPTSTTVTMPATRNFDVRTKGTGGMEAYKVLVPLEKQRGQTLSVGIQVAGPFYYYALAGFSVEVTDGAVRGNR